MPQVGKKHFEYDESGYAAAKAESQKTGLPIEKAYATGGPVDRTKREVGARGNGSARPQKFRITAGG